MQIENENQARELLEMIVDRFGLYAVADMVGGICHDKAEHLESNWGDTSGAMRWAKAGRRFHAVERELRKLQNRVD